MSTASQPSPTTSGLTDQQRRAVTARGVSVAVSAGAGCGKTLVLTERFLAELTPDDSQAPAAANRERRSRLGQLVAITFTERAAREMRDRIRKACQKRLQDCPDEQADYWLELIRDLDSARISTIHSFCASLLRAHAVEAGIDPRFRVLDGTQAATVLFELTDDVLRQRLADRDETTLTLVTRFGLDKLRTMIAKLLNARQTIDWAAWLAETPDSLVARWETFWRTNSMPRMLRRIGESPAARSVVDLATRYPPSHPTMRERCDFLREELPKFCGADGAEGEGIGKTPVLQKRLTDIRDAARVQGGGTKKHWISEAVYEQFRDVAKALRDMIDKTATQMQFDPAAARPAACLAMLVLHLAADLTEQYDQKKQELGVLDFNDLLIRARGLLTDPRQEGLRKRLAAQIRLLLVDEFQDTDELQVEMVKALCDNEHLRGKLFFVGDHKQSIYRFRGAQPKVFRGLHAEIPDGGRLSLSLNFRSQPGVLDFVNALFADEMGPDYEPLQASRQPAGSGPAIEFLWAGDGQEANDKDGEKPHELPPVDPGSDDSMGPRERLRRREADWIARRIRILLDDEKPPVWDKESKRMREVRPGDIVLLFRALSNVEYYEDALQRYGIGYYLVGGHAFYAQQEIYDLLNLLRTLDSPADEVSLAGVLRSPMFSLHDETLLWLCAAGGRRSKGLAAGLFAAELPRDIEDEQRRRAERAAATIRELRALKDRLPVAELIQTAMERTGYDAVLLAEFLGERKLANLYKLIEQARSFDRAGIFTLSDFITQLAEFVARQPDEPLAATCPESANVVRLMTIHQAKGLEFPVVIVPDVGRPRRAMPPAVAFTPELGPVLKDPDAVTGYDLLMAVENDEELAELTRLFYVAATRAADRLILAAGVEQLDKPTGPWMELLARRFDLVEGRRKACPEGCDRDRSRASLGTSKQTPRCVQNDATEECEKKSDDSLSVRVIASTPAIRSKPVDLRQRRDVLKILNKAQQMAELGQGFRPCHLAPIASDPTQRRQYSFSRLSGKLHAAASVDAAPWNGDVPAAPALDPRGLGTLVHAALSQIDFHQPQVVADLVRQLAEEHLPNTDRSLDEPIAMVERFLASPRAADIAKASEIHHELEFLLAWPPGGDCAGRPSTSDRYLQGCIDCLYRDAEGRWRLIDYKTNRVTTETLAATAATYEMQMLVYGLAAETILKEPPAELTLCFLRSGSEHHFMLDASARRRVIEMVNEALP
ncbi:MAG: UvrD-helicase domain-containing protein [Planctomycetaceae bacterium]|nr:UvrD-helicase domain-containing protein [Planctomycetaceae bacterium]